MALLQKPNFPAMAALAAVSICSLVSAQTPAPDYVATKMNLYTATSEAWRTDHGFQSTIRLKNMLAIASIDVNLTLYMADGTPYVLPPVHLEKSGVALVNINTALATAPSSLADHISHSGSAELQYRYDWAGAVLGTVSILDTVRSLQFVGRFIFPSPVSIAAASKATTIQAMWWKYSAGSNVFLSAVNPTDQEVQADVTVSDQRAQPTGSRRLVLGPHASKVEWLDDLIGTAPNSLLGGIQISYSGVPSDMLFSGGIEDRAVGYSAKIPLTIASTLVGSSATAAGTGSSCTVASAGLMVGTPDPMEGFPSTVTFAVFGFARNASGAPITLRGIFNYMDKAGPHSITLPDEQLQDGEARNLNLGKTVSLPFRNGMVNLSYTYDAPCGSLLLSAGSVDATGNYVFEVDPQTVGKSKGSISQYWQVGAGTDTMYSLWNPSTVAEDLMVTVYYDHEGKYRFPLHLEPNASAMISMKDLIRKEAPDAEGRVIPARTRMGSLTVVEKNPDLRDMATFVLSSGTYNPVTGTCCQNFITCDGAVSSQISPSPLNMAVGSTQSLSVYVTEDTGQQLNYTSSATWSSGNTSFFTIQSGQATAVGAGSTTLNASVGGVPIYVAQYSVCAGACPTGAWGASGSASAYDATPVITGVSPNSILVGVPASVSISGQHFGTNTPQVSISLGGTVQVTSYGDTSIQAIITAANPGIGTLTVTAEGYGGQGFLGNGGGGGQSAQSQIAAVPIQMKLDLVGTAISTDGNYSEDTTIRITAVRSDTGAVVTAFNGPVNIMEDGTTIYMNNYTQSPGGLPAFAVLFSGTATFLARSLANPVGSSRPNPALIKTQYYSVYGGNSLSIPQWVYLGQIDPKANGQVYAWVQARTRDIFQNATGDLATVLSKIRSYSISGTISGGGQTQALHVYQSDITINPYFMQMRVNTDGGVKCGATRSHYFKSVLAHEARHAYQDYLSAQPGNDTDGDFLVNVVLIPPYYTILDTTSSRYGCDPSPPLGRILRETYQGDSVPDAWSTVTLALEEDAYVYSQN